MWDRAKLFLRFAGTMILGINILLWFLASYPRSAATHEAFAARRQGIVNTRVEPLNRSTAGPAQPAASTIQRFDDSTNSVAARLLALDREEAGERLRRSFAGRLGKLIEPVIAPLGFDWKIGIGIVASFAAREVFVSTMSVVYNVADSGKTAGASAGLVRTLQDQVRPDGTPVYTTLTAITLMVFYVLALQCASTVAVVRRETNGWRWPVFQWAYMGVLAWTLAFAVRVIGHGFGWQ
jgi:ferrous iron transport protein B